VDSAGNAYVTGIADSTDFPTTPGALQTTFQGGGDDAFVSKLNPSGSALVYSTYLGGSDEDGGFGIALDSAGNAYVTGDTVSSDFPTTAGALQPIFGGGYGAFLSKLNFAGLAFSSFGGKLLIDPDAGVFYLKGSFILGSGGSINPHTEPVTFGVGKYSVTLPAGSFTEYTHSYLYQKTVNHVFLCVYIRNTGTTGRYSLLANGGRGALTGTTTSPVPVTLTIGDDSGSTLMDTKFPPD
jgi:beta-propeller repeat-containing protein